MRFVVTGLSRSGTKFAAKLWTELGYRCGHESVFNIHKVMSLPVVSELSGFKEADGDSSFLAAPYLNELPSETVVFHQLRDPLQVIRSHLGIRFFADPPVASMYLADNHVDFVDYIKFHRPQIAAERAEVHRCATYWVAWNDMIADAVERRGLRYVRYRLEDLDPDLIRRMISLLGDEVDDGQVERALASVPDTTNTRPRDESVDWEGLPDGPAKTAVLRAAERYGYASVGVRS